MSWGDFMINNLEWAFNHDKSIGNALMYFHMGQFNIDYFNTKMNENEKNG